VTATVAATGSTSLLLLPSSMRLRGSSASARCKSSEASVVGDVSRPASVESFACLSRN